ncbi:MAG: hypothetical protein WD824_27260 [Cyclobacteriaceae bacterium]
MTIRNSSLVLLITIMGTVACVQKSNVSSDAFMGEITVCGTVQFSDGCGDEVDKTIAYGLALIHHMTYEEAGNIFTKVTEENEDCFWGLWGKGLSYIHPLWNDPPSEEKLTEGWNLAQQALKLAKNEKEIGYAKALAAYYENGPQKTEKERLKNYHDAWKIAFESNVADLEAKTFYALSLIAISDPADKTFANQLKAGKLSEEVLQVINDHPGAFHYIIHAYDYPGLSDKALAVANMYGKIAPQIPHALHMPTHIFTRLGMWKESIDWNKRSAEAAFQKTVDGSISMHYFHALDYLVYAYMQTAEDNKARMILEDLKKLEGSFQMHPATAYSLAATQSRFLLERQDWKNASALTLPGNVDFWNKFPEYEALTHFAVGLGAARNGSPVSAKKALERLNQLQSLIKIPYWSGQVEIQKNIINAWLALGRGSKKEAVALMTLASDQEWATQKHPITPGELLPARELFGDLLLSLNQSKEALEQYEMTLQRSPGRMNSLYGAARSAELSGDQQKAKLYYQQLMDLTSGAERSLEKTQKAAEFLKNT